MTRFRDIDEQAKRLVMKRTKHKVSRVDCENSGLKIVRLLGTEYKYRGCIKIFLNWCKSSRINTSQIREEVVGEFFRQNVHKWCQKTLDGYRQSLNLVFDLNLKYVLSEKPTFLSSRAYSEEQIQYLLSNATDRMKISIQIAAASGLRAVELDTISNSSDLMVDDRNWLSERFNGLGGGKNYVVIGKGGLHRNIFLNEELSKKLELLKLDTTVIKTSRKIHYLKRYDLIGGQIFSQQFSRLSMQIFNWSTGAHGLRHGYAQNRLKTLQVMGYSWKHAVEIVSQELGHFSISNTLTYFR